MKHIVEFKIFESYSDYNIGDVVLIRYKITGDITPVKIIKKYSKNSFLVSHKNEESMFTGAKDETINISQIIGPYKQLDNMGDTTMRATKNPAINPRVDDRIAISNTDTTSAGPTINRTLSNDISF